MSEMPDSLKTQYFHDRNAGLGGTAAPHRVAQGERELLTFDILARLAGYPQIMQPEAGALIDAGCGDRYIEPAVRQRGFDYLGLDIGDIDFETGRLPLPDHSVDLFVSLAVIEHLRDPALFLSEAMRVVRPGGGVILSTPNFQMDFKNFYNDPTHVKPYTPHSLAKVMTLTGLEGVSVFPGLRCKPDWYYQGKNRFWKARYLLPFRGDNRFAPSWLKGRSTSLFAIGRKPG
ncbi:bifunctional 2-polyprenyl-6-hydroxyphenol methylase/3-demethylubiquinol 3-O-methyltransferase UbiG [Asticcacaulis sp. YBE204]|uniref:class I SAM-dependent methyltransferase n=1 Tax=Asticcacaulis sp. YBE204 TaxID=1282363 RepID=UPI0003C3E645|nr:class I SAM-dependent methyltransferase [Asticcacaulis sp. YBE204]ESQ77014.1 hypothetical protein AEYBE204_18165 [Asticcacaulis sp. YBE204]